MCQVESLQPLQPHQPKERTHCGTKQAIDLGDQPAKTGDRAKMFMDPIVRALCRAAEKKPFTFEDFTELSDVNFNSRREEAWRLLFIDEETNRQQKALRAERQRRREADACTRAAAATQDCFAPQWVGDVQLQFFIEL